VHGLLAGFFLVHERAHFRVEGVGAHGSRVAGVDGGCEGEDEEGWGFSACVSCVFRGLQHIRRFAPHDIDRQDGIYTC
jgi:hypothetical protein